jgi:capsular exopolysaccharide synthesis family protein
MSRIDEALARLRGTDATSPDSALDAGRSESESAAAALQHWPVASDAGGRTPINGNAAPASELPLSVPTPVEPASEDPQELRPRMPSSITEKVIVGDILPGAAEQYRRIAAALHHVQADRQIKVVMVVSAVGGDGKTLTAANLALTLSESYRRRVLLVDADLRRPCLHALFEENGLMGLTDGLRSTKEQPLPIRQVSQWLSLLPAGRPDPDPMSALTSSRMQRVIEEARELFDWVIIDTPPVAVLPDANLLAAMVDGAVLVIRAGSTPYPMAKRAIEAIGRERILGVVLNAAEGSSHTDYDAYYGQYGRTDITGP